MGGTDRESSSQVRAYDNEIVPFLWPVPVSSNWLVVSFSLWQCVQTPVFCGKLLLVLRRDPLQKGLGVRCPP